MLRKIVLAFAAMCALFAAACGKSGVPEKTYALKGVIVSLDPQVKTATIKHEQIGDWMGAMTMEFPVKDPAGLAKLQPGQKITATVHTRPDTFEYWITDIHIGTP